MTVAYLNRIATAVPENDVHQAFVSFAGSMLEDRRTRMLFQRMAGKAAISYRYSCLQPAANPTGNSIDAADYYARGQFPSTASRMQVFERHAPLLAQTALDRLKLAVDTHTVTHVIVTCCTGLYAPGLDFEVVRYLGLDPRVERTMVGFMGCYAAINALKLARHIVRSEPASRVLVLNLELCTLHLQETQNLEEVLSFLVFADGCAASLISAARVGLALDRFQAVQVPDTAGLITWRIGELGFDMFLSGQVPVAIGQSLKEKSRDILGNAAPEQIDLWAVHPGGRSVLDAVEQGMGLASGALAASRDILARFGNMSSASIMFVLQSLMEKAQTGQRGCALSFGPGLTVETMLFHAA